MSRSILFLPFLLMIVFPSYAFKFARTNYVYSFPRDHGAHPDFSIEWWYYTGHLKSESGKIFGFQWTLFRNSLSQQEIDNSHPFQSNQVYFVHGSLLDKSKDEFLFADDRSRGFVSESYASNEDLDLRVKNWFCKRSGDEHVVKAVGNGFSYELRIKPVKPLVFHGTNGVTFKGGHKDNASHYLSYTRMKVLGKITINGVTENVSGQAWMDHEFSSSQLATDAVGWDWFSIQMDDNTEYMIYLLRKADGTLFKESSASFIDEKGRVDEIPLSDLEYRVQSEKSPIGGKVSYPNQFEIRFRNLDRTLKVKVNSRSSEIDSKKSTGVIYWESPVDAVLEKRNGKVVKGVGYVELTGYKGSSLNEKL